MPRYWYVLPTSSDDPYNPVKYSRILGSFPGCPNPGAVICAIYADAGNTFPTSPQFTSGHNLYDYITDALVDPFVPQPQGFGEKIFVYTKPLT